LKLNSGRLRVLELGQGLERILRRPWNHYVWLHRRNLAHGDRDPVGTNAQEPAQVDDGEGDRSVSIDDEVAMTR
jgi:hypothetical protein